LSIAYPFNLSDYLITGRLWGAFMRNVALVALTSLIMGGCASSSDKITATYVSPIQYENYNCRQLAEEAQRLSRRASDVAGAQDSQATKDTVATAVAVVIFWPAAFMVGGDRNTAAELGRMKGEMEAIEQVSIRKNCGIQFRKEGTVAQR
jgi:uncharacterized protein YceK